MEALADSLNSGFIREISKRYQDIEEIAKENGYSGIKEAYEAFISANTADRESIFASKEQATGYEIIEAKVDSGRKLRAIQTPLFEGMIKKGYTREDLIG